MIRRADTEFHHPADAGHGYAETNFFCFTLPEQRLMVSAYTVTRKGIGTMAADVVVFGDLVSDRAQCLYIDSQQHLPAPEFLSDYRTPNGLIVKAINERDYHVEYKGYDGVEFEIDFAGLMEPFDIHDPTHSPKAKAHSSDAERHAGSGLGAGYGGHFDLTGRVTGNFVFAGTRYEVDCIETMDHSWGDRPELGIHSMGWMHAHFGPDLAIHWIAAYDPAAPIDRQWTLAHGYVMEDGQVYGLTELHLRSTCVGRVLVGMELVAVDRRGRKYELSGSSIIGAPWTCYVATEAYCALVRWTMAGGRVGYGMCHRSRSWGFIKRCVESAPEMRGMAFHLLEALSRP